MSRENFNLEKYKEAANVYLHLNRQGIKAVLQNLDRAIEDMRNVQTEEEFDEQVNKWPEQIMKQIVWDDDIINAYFE